MPALSKEETMEIVKSKKGNKKCQDSAAGNAKSFFRSALVDPAFDNLLSHKKHSSKNNIAHFMLFFKGHESDAELSESSTEFSCVALRAKKKHPRKKVTGRSMISRTIVAHKALC